MKTLYLAIGITALLLLGNQSAAAQSSYVEGVSAIINAGTSATQIETFSETFETADIAYYYEAYVEGYLYQNGALITDGYALGVPYTNDAYGYLTQPLHVPDTYEIQSDHYVVAYYTSYDPYTGTYEYDNPNYFSNDGSYGGSNDFMPGSSSCGCYYENRGIYFPRHDGGSDVQRPTCDQQRKPHRGLARDDRHADGQRLQSGRCVYTDNDGNHLWFWYHVVSCLAERSPSHDQLFREHQRQHGEPHPDTLRPLRQFLVNDQRGRRHAAGHLGQPRHMERRRNYQRDLWREELRDGPYPVVQQFAGDRHDHKRIEHANRSERYGRSRSARSDGHYHRNVTRLRWQRIHPDQ
jgi:hypothetical protein